MKLHFSGIASFRSLYRDDSIFGMIFLIVLVIPIAFSLWTFENYEVIKWFFWILLVAGALLVAVRGKVTAFRYEPGLSAILAALLAWAGLATVFSVDRVNSIFGFYPRFSGSLLFWIVFAVFILLIVHTLTREKLIVLLKLSVFVSVVISAIALLQTVGVGFYDGLDGPAFSRVPGLLGNPNFSSMFIVSMVPIIILFAFNAGSRVSRAYYMLSGFLVLWATGAMGSRGAILGLLSGAAIILIVLPGFRVARRAVWYAVAATTAAAVLFGAFYMVSRPDTVDSTVRFSEANISTRLAVWSLAGQIIAERPWFGSGLGNFHILFEQYRSRQGFNYDGIFDDAHNIFLEIGATGGAPLLLIFLSLIIWSTRVGIRTLRQEKDWLPAALLAGMGAFLAAGLFTPVALPCYMLLGLFIAGLCYRAVPSPTVVSRYSGTMRIAAAILGLAGVGYALSFFAAEILFFQGMHQYLNHHYAKAYSYESAAVRLNPFNPLYYVYLAGSKAQLNYPAESIVPVIEKITMLHSHDGRGYRQKAGLYFLLYKKYGTAEYLQAALDNGKESIVFDPYFTERYSFMTHLTYLTGRYDEALSYTIKYLVLNDKDFEAWMIAAKLYQLRGERTQTLGALNKAYHLRPDILQLQHIMRAVKEEPDIQQIPIDIILSDTTNLE